jgi:hypothetical protein
MIFTFKGLPDGKNPFRGMIGLEVAAPGPRAVGLLRKTFFYPL